MSVTIVKPPGRFNVPSVRGLWAAREVAVRLAQRDIIVRYRQTVLGVAWVIIQPLASAGIFTVVFGHVANLSSGGVPYFLFSLGGMLIWNIFNGTLTRGASSLVSNQALVAKVFFPRLLVPLSTVAAIMVDFCVGLALSIVMLFVYGINPGWQVLLVPVWTILAASLGMGLGMAASALMVKYRDINYILPWLTQILLYASPVAYALSSVPDHFRWVFEINPATWFLEAFRWSLIGTEAPIPWQVLGLVIVCPLVLVLGTLVFQAYEREFADVI